MEAQNAILVSSTSISESLQSEELVVPSYTLTFSIDEYLESNIDILVDKIAVNFVYITELLDSLETYDVTVNPCINVKDELLTDELNTAGIIYVSHANDLLTSNTSHVIRFLPIILTTVKADIQVQMTLPIEHQTIVGRIEWLQL